MDDYFANGDHHWYCTECQEGFDTVEDPTCPKCKKDCVGSNRRLGRSLLERRQSLKKADVSEQTSNKHFEVRCRSCDALMGQCRCPGPDKEVRYSLCDRCGGDEPSYESAEEKEAAQHDAPAVLVQRRGRSEEVLVCPHCSREIEEKSLYRDAKGWLFHRPCFVKGKGSIRLPEKRGGAEHAEQETPASCGPAALKGVLEALGKSVSEATLRDQAGTDPDDGTRPDDLAEAARKHGVAAERVEGMSDQALKDHLDAGRAVILAVQSGGTEEEKRADSVGHYVAAYDYDADGVMVRDPDSADPSVKIAWDRLAADWHDRDADGRRYERMGIVITPPAEKAAYGLSDLAGLGRRALDAVDPYAPGVLEKVDNFLSSLDAGKKPHELLSNYVHRGHDLMAGDVFKGGVRGYDLMKGLYATPLGQLGYRGRTGKWPQWHLPKPLPEKGQFGLDAHYRNFAAGPVPAQAHLAREIYKGDPSVFRKTLGLLDRLRGEPSSLRDVAGDDARAFYRSLFGYLKTRPDLLSRAAGVRDPAALAALDKPTQVSLLEGYNRDSPAGRDMADRFARRWRDGGSIASYKGLARVASAPARGLEYLKKLLASYEAGPDKSAALLDQEQVRQLAAAPPVRNFLRSHGLARTPGLNLFDNAAVNAGRADQWDAVAAAADSDRETYKQLLRGLANAAGARRGAQFESSIDAASRNISKLAPYAMTLAPDLWDQLHGSRGSAASLASSMQRVHRDRTPLENASAASQVMARLHGPGGQGSSGFSAKELGTMYEQMGHAGLLGERGGLNPSGQATRLFDMGRAVRAMSDAGASLDKRGAVSPRLLRRVAGVAAGGLGALGGGLLIHHLLSRRPAVPAALHGRPVTPTPVAKGVHQAVGPRGEFRGFQTYSQPEKVQLFQTENPVSHPGYNRQPPKKPDLLMRLTDPYEAAKARDEVDRVGVDNLW